MPRASVTCPACACCSSRRWATDVRAALRALGHDVGTAGIGIVRRRADRGEAAKGWAAGSDPRKDGLAIGY